MRRGLIPILKVMFIGVLAVAMAACGGSAAPGGTGGTPVAVELPNITDVPYLTATVAVSSADLSAPIPFGAKSAWKLVTKAIAVSGNPFTAGTSLNACQTRNRFVTLLSSSADGDLALCMVKEMIAPVATVNYTGGNNDFKITYSGELFDVRFNVTKTGGSISDLKVYVCSGGAQTTYVAESFSGATMQASSKSIASASRSTAAVTAALNSLLQYTSKTVDNAETRQSTSTFTAKGTMIQGASSALVNAFSKEIWTGGGATNRTHSSFALSNSSTSTLDPRLYEIGSGAANFLYSSAGIAPEYQECWDGTTLAASGSCSYLSNLTTPRAVEDVSISGFSTAGGDAVDCSTLSPTTISGDITSGACGRFVINSSELDCFISTKGNFTVTGSYGGAALSASSTSPTTVGASPQLVLTTANGYPAGTSQFNTDTIILNLCPGGTCGDVDNNNNLVTESGLTSWASNYTVLTFSPTSALTSGQKYKLTIRGVANSDGSTNTYYVSGAGNTGVSGNKLATTLVYYLTAQ